MAFLPMSSANINQAIKTVVKPAHTPLHERVATRPLTEPNPTDVAQISAPPIKKQTLAFNPEIHSDESTASYQQLCSNAQAVYALASLAGLKDIATAALALAREDQTLRGSGVGLG